MKATSGDFTPGAEPVSVDYASKSSLASALNGVDVVVSSIAYNALKEQEALAIASKEAGVKLFVPSDFGPNSIGMTSGMYGDKEKFRAFVEELGLPYAVFFCGPWTDFIFIP